MPYRPTLVRNDSWVMCAAISSSGQGAPPGLRTYFGFSIDEVAIAYGFVNGQVPDYSNPIVCSTESCNSQTAAGVCSPVPRPSPSPFVRTYPAQPACRTLLPRVASRAGLALPMSVPLCLCGR